MTPLAPLPFPPGLTAAIPDAVSAAVLDYGATRDSPVIDWVIVAWVDRFGYTRLCEFSRNVAADHQVVWWPIVDGGGRQIALASPGVARLKAFLATPT